MIQTESTTTDRPTAALVLETNNLRGGEGDGDVVASLERLLVHLTGQSYPLADLAELVVTHDGLSTEAMTRLERAAGRAVRFVALAPEGGYYQAKNAGFDATTADIVVFGDADCWPDRVWLELLLAPFSRAPETRIVAGRTTYRDDLVGAAITAIDFMYFEGPHGDGTTRNFYANNVAFRRAVFAAHRYRAAPGIYRGHCQRLGLELCEAGVPIHFEPAARTLHRFPDRRRELLKLRLLRGADTAEITPDLARAVLSPRMQWIGKLGPASALGVLAVRFGCSVRAFGHQDMRPRGPASRAAALGTVAAVSACDAVGALGRSIFGLRFDVHDGGLRERALSYHGDRDVRAAAA